jgi:hypothetical protein
MVFVLKRMCFVYAHNFNLLHKGDKLGYIKILFYYHIYRSSTTLSQSG